VRGAFFELNNKRFFENLFGKILRGRFLLVSIATIFRWGRKMNVIPHLKMAAIETRIDQKQH
jgi:hypothetical protein